eukprot:3146981-Prymnesium_polylepis.1
MIAHADDASHDDEMKQVGHVPLYGKLKACCKQQNESNFLHMHTPRRTIASELAPESLSEPRPAPTLASCHTYSSFIGSRPSLTGY